MKKTNKKEEHGNQLEDERVYGSNICNVPEECSKELKEKELERKRRE